MLAVGWRSAVNTMGEYADIQIRADIKRMTGVYPGDMSDDDRPTKKFVKPVYKRVKCPHCDAKTKEAGLRDHLHDVHNL